MDLATLFSKRSDSGFTLIELVVSVGIFAFFSTLTLANYPQFKNKVGLDLLTHQVALVVRQAQTYGLGVRSFNGTFPAYGVAFDVRDADASKRFVLFADGGSVPHSIPANNGRYDSVNGCGATDGDTECVELFKLSGSNKILDICVNNSDRTHPENCGYKQLEISFKRPDPDSVFCAVEEGESSCAITPVIADAEVVIGQETDDLLNQTMITVWKTGQISVKKNLSQ